MAVESALSQNQVNSVNTKTKTVTTVVNGKKVSHKVSKTTYSSTEASSGSFIVEPGYTFHLTKKLDLGEQIGIGDTYGIHNTALVNKIYYLSESRLIYHYNNWLNLRASYQLQSPFNEQYYGWVNTIKIGPDFAITRHIGLTTSYVYNFAGTLKGNGFETGFTYKF